MGAALGLAALIALVYGGSLSHGFVFDDWQLVVENDVVTWPLSRWADAPAPRRGGVSYRRVRMFSYMVDRTLAGGLDPATFHASNLVYHGLVVLALYALAWCTTGSWAAACVAAGLFAVHPLGSEAVVYVSGRRDLLATLFTLAGLLTWWRFCEARMSAGRTVATLVATLGFAVLALGAKENAAVFPALAFLLYVAHARRDPTLRGATSTTWMALSAGMIALYAVIDRIYLDRLQEAWIRLTEGPLAPQPALSLHVLGRYGSLALWPSDLSADYRPPAWPLPTTSLDGAAAASLLAWLTVLAAGVILLWRGRGGAGLLWFPVALLPVSQIVPYREIVSEHNAYLPLAGLALAAGDATAGLARHRPRATLIVAVVLIAALGARAHARTGVWRDDETLWSHTLEERPASLRAKQNLAASWARGNRLEAAGQLLRRAHAEAPADVGVLGALAILEGRLGNDGEALSLARRAVEIQPDAETYALLGWTHFSMGADASARAAFEQALAFDPRSEDARDGVARVDARERQKRYLRHGTVR